MIRLASLHLAANAVLLGLGYYWLGLGESTAAWLIASFVVAACLLAFGSLAYGATFAYFQQDPPAVAPAWRGSLRNLQPLIICALLIVVIYWILGVWGYVFAKPALPIASWLTLKLQKPIRPGSIERIFTALLWLVRWVLLPVLILPVAASVAGAGWRGFRSMGSVKKLYWLQAPLLLLTALWLPLKLIAWVPALKSFPLETLSAVLRLGLAYLLFTFAWLVLAFVTSAGRPCLTQPSTAPSP